MHVERNLPDDPVLLHLKNMLDPDHMAGELLAHGFESTGRFEAKACAIERVKYKPGRNCLISYRLKCSDRTNGEAFVRRFCGRAYEAGGSASRYQKAMAQQMVIPQNGPPLFHLPKLDMVVWVFPNDRKLQNLPKLVDEATLSTTQLTPALQQAFGPGNFKLTSHRLIHYAPEHTCCVRVDGEWRSKSDAESTPMTLYGKTYYDDRGAETWQVMSQLFELREHGRPGPKTPRPLRYDAGQHILWQEGLPGKNLADCTPAPALYAATATAIAALHRTQIVCGQRISAPDMMDGFDRLSAAVAGACPDMSSPAMRLVDLLLREAPNQAGSPIATLHGDFHAQNVLIDGDHDDRVALIDLDNVMLGPPLHDVGSFIAGTLYRALVDRAPLASVLPLIRSFLAGYRAAVLWPVDDDEVAWYTATALLQERTYRAVTRLKAGRLALIADLIQLADRLARDGFGGLDDARRAVA